MAAMRVNDAIGLCFREKVHMKLAIAAKKLLRSRVAAERFFQLSNAIAVDAAIEDIVRQPYEVGL